MNRYTKIIGIVIGLGLLVALAFFIAPQIGSLVGAGVNEDIVPSSDIENSDGAMAFSRFMTELNATKQFSFCAIKTVEEKGDGTELFLGLR